MANLCEEILEHDLNPLIVFDSNGKIKRYNSEAEFLLSYVSVEELYDIAITNASKHFGFSQKYIDLQYGKFHFYALLIGYLDDEEIALKLYKRVNTKLHTINDKKLQYANIFSLIELSKNTVFMENKIAIDEIYDVSIPEMKLDINNFLLCLNESLQHFKNHKRLTIKVYVKVGEYERINQKKYPIIVIEFEADKAISFDSKIEQKAQRANIITFFEKNKIILEFAAIT